MQSRLRDDDTTIVEDSDLTDLDKETQDFLHSWLQNNKTHVSVSGQGGHWWKQENSVHDLSSVEERLLQLETDKDSLQLQVTVRLPTSLGLALHLDNHRFLERLRCPGGTGGAVSTVASGALYG